MDPELFTTLLPPSPEFYPILHPPFSQIQVPTYELGDLTEMESMQFVNPHEVYPIVPNEPMQSASVFSEVSSKKINMPETGDLTQNNIKLKMEEFSDLSSLFLGAKIPLKGAADELDTPLFDEDAFNFIPQPPVKSNENNGDLLKVKVEYNAQIYSGGKNMYRDLNLTTENQVQNKENYSISKLGNDQTEMNLYQPYAHNVSYKNTSDDIYSSQYQDLHYFDGVAANSEVSSDINLSVTNIKYSNSTEPSPQDDRYSYISSPGNDQQADFSMTDHDHSYETKPKLNLMIDQFQFPIKNEGPSMLNTPDVIDEVVNMGNNFNILDLINNEDITILTADEELMASLTSPSISSLPPSTPSTTTSSQPSSPTKISRRRKISSVDDDDDYIPPTKRKSTVRLTDIDIEDSNSSDESDYETKKSSSKKNKSNKVRGRPPKRADSVHSESSRDTNVSKYRELRDKNNEASRKSRLKRRIKEVEYEQEADELHSKNIRLKAQVEELEKMVSTFRNNLFRILVTK